MIVGALNLITNQCAGPWLWWGLWRRCSSTCCGGKGVHMCVQLCSQLHWPEPSHPPDSVILNISNCTSMWHHIDLCFILNSITNDKFNLIIKTIASILSLFWFRVCLILQICFKLFFCGLYLKQRSSLERHVWN